MEDYPLEYYQFFVHFNEGDYYTCHDLLEEIWLVDRSNLFIKGLLQMCVAIYHYEYGNVKGARALMETAYKYIQPYRPKHFMEECITIIPQHIDQIEFERVNSLPRLPEFYLFLEDE